MCVIIIKQKENKVSRDTLENASIINADGMGVVWLDTFEVSYHESYEWKILDTTRPYIAHFRYATVGAVNRRNTHPFVCGKQTDELLMMNGTIAGKGNYLDCDSRVLAKEIGKMPRQTWKKKLAKYDCRFVSINLKTKSFQIYNRHLYTYKDGVWYSKTNILQDNIIGVYGTLKKGYSNYTYYLSNARYVGRGKTQDKYPLIVDGLPYLLDEKGVGHNVEIDVFKVSDGKMKSIDGLEGHPTWYRRKPVPVKLEDGTIVVAWIYFNIQEKISGRALHETYVKPKIEWAPRASYIDWYDKPTYNYNSWESPDYYKETNQYFGETETKTEKKEPQTKYCISCYSTTLEHDTFNMYYCRACLTYIDNGNKRQL